MSHRLGQESVCNQLWRAWSMRVTPDKTLISLQGLHSHPTFYIVYFIWNKVSLCSFNGPGTCCADQGVLVASQVLGLKCLIPGYPWQCVHLVWSQKLSRVGLVSTGMGDIVHLYIYMCRPTSKLNKQTNEWTKRQHWNPWKWYKFVAFM